MKVTRVSVDENGLSFFNDFEIQLKNAGDIGFLSKQYPVKNIIFRETPGNYHYDWHTAPNKQFVIMQDGAVEIEVGTGEKRIFDTGDVILLEDTTGKGHISKAVNGQSRKSIFVILE